MKKSMVLILGASIFVTGMTIGLVLSLLVKGLGIGNSGRNRGRANNSKKLYKMYI